MLSRLGFGPAVPPYCCVTVELDDRRLTLESDDGDNDGRVIARLLQGWMPQDLGLERETWRPRTAVLVRLPGGDRPEMLASDVARFAGWEGVPVLGFDEASPRMVVEISFSRSRVHWAVDGERFDFARSAYNRAVGDLLVLVGESAELISEEEWRTPTPTRVVLWDEARRIAWGY